MKFGEIFFFKNHTENEGESLIQTSFCFLKKRYSMQKQVVSSLVSLYFDSSQISIQLKQTVNTEK